MLFLRLRAARGTRGRVGEGAHRERRERGSARLRTCRRLEMAAREYEAGAFKCRNTEKQDSAVPISIR